MWLELNEAYYARIEPKKLPCFYFLVYIHDKEDQVLMAIGDTSREISSIQLNIATQLNDFIFEVKLTEKRLTTLDKDGGRCRDYGDFNFNSCTKMFFYEFLKDKINCSIAGKACQFFG